MSRLPLKFIILYKAWLGTGTDAMMDAHSLKGKPTQFSAASHESLPRALLTEYNQETYSERRNS